MLKKVENMIYLFGEQLAKGQGIPGNENTPHFRGLDASAPEVKSDQQKSSDPVLFRNLHRELIALGKSTMIEIMGLFEFTYVRSLLLCFLSLSVPLLR